LRSCQEPRLEYCRLGDRRLQVRLDQAGHLLPNDLGPSKAEKTAERIVGPRDAERRIEKQRTPRRVFQPHKDAARRGGSGP